MKRRKQLPLYPQWCREIDRLSDHGVQGAIVEDFIETGLDDGIGRVWDQSHGHPVLPYDSKTGMLGWFGLLLSTRHGTAVQRRMDTPVVIAEHHGHSPMLWVDSKDTPAP